MVKQNRRLNELLFKAKAQLSANAKWARAFKSYVLDSGRQKRWLVTGIILGLTAVLAFTVVATAIYGFYSSRFVSPTDLAVNAPAAGAKILDRNGTPLYQFADDREGLRKPVGLDDVSETLVAATVATEDSSFYDNQGVNTKGLLRAVWQNFNPLSGHFLDGSGGSSITQQLIKNVYIAPSRRSNRSINRKLQEAVYAIKLTDEFSKDQILQWYVNQISYGGVFNGIEAASEAYFNKPARELTLSQSALLAGLPQAPSAYNPIIHPDAALARRNEVLDLMAGHARIQIRPDKYYVPNKAEIDAAKQEPLGLTPQHFPIEAPHFVFSYVQPELETRFGKDALYHGGLVVTTTLDLNLQMKANATLEQWIAQYEDTSNSHNGAITVIDPRSGEILVMVGSRDYFRDDIQGQVNNVLAASSPGSTFKPFVYLDSFLKLGWGPATTIDDSPVSYRESDGSIFQPSNPAHDYHGTITLRSALGNSLNVPAFKVAMATGVQNIVSYGKQIGFTSLTGQYGPAIAIGGVDLSELDLAYGYSVLANGGVMRGQVPVTPHRTGEREIDPIPILKVTDRAGKAMFDAGSQRKEKQIAPPEQTFLINSILSDPNAQCITFGCGGLSIPGHVAAVKTGTSEPFERNGPNAGKIGDTWAFGYTPDVVVGVWAGNADKAPITNILSTSIAFRTMRDTMVAYFAGKPSTLFSQPQGVVRASVCFPNVSPVSGRCSSIIQDFFLKGSPASVSTVRGPEGLGQPTIPPQAIKPTQQPPGQKKGNGVKKGH
jgi:membrane peptidoglycan carboxypeptidase